MKSLTEVVTSLALATALAIPAVAQSNNQDEPQNSDAKTNQAPAETSADVPAEASAEQAKEKEKSVRKLIVITLKHRDPQQLQQIISLRHGGPTQGLQGRAFNRQALAAAQARAAGQAAGAEAAEEEKLSIAVAADEKLLFVRGSDKQIEEIQKLVEALDVQDEEIAPIDYANHRLIPIRSDKAAAVQTTLTQLELSGNTLQMGQMTLIAFRTDEDNAEQSKQAEEVIQKLNAHPGGKSKAEAGKKADATKKTNTEEKAGAAKKADSPTKTNTAKDADAASGTDAEK